jgi:hypothetical protein
VEDLVSQTIKSKKDVDYPNAHEKRNIRNFKKLKKEISKWIEELENEEKI